VIHHHVVVVLRQKNKISSVGAGQISMAWKFNTTLKTLVLPFCTCDMSKDTEDRVVNLLKRKAITYKHNQYIPIIEKDKCDQDEKSSLENEYI